MILEQDAQAAVTAKEMILTEGKDALQAVDAMTIQNGPCKGKSMLYGLRTAILISSLEQGIVSLADAAALMSEWGYDPDDLETLRRA